MKKKNIRELFNKQVMSGIAVVGLMFMLIIYVFVYLKYTQLTAELETSNQKLEASLSELKEYYDNMEQYQKDSKEIEKNIKKIMKEYPADAKEEDVIMLAVSAQEENDLNYDNINMTESSLVYAVPSNIVTAAGIEAYTEEIDFMEKKATYVNNTNYDNMKGIIEQIYASPNRIAIENIYYKATEDSEVLEGMIDLCFYSATGTGTEYVVPEIDEYISGTKNPFQQ